MLIGIKAGDAPWCELTFAPLLPPSRGGPNRTEVVCLQPIRRTARHGGPIAAPGQPKARCARNPPQEGLAHTQHQSLVPDNNGSHKQVIGFRRGLEYEHSSGLLGDPSAARTLAWPCLIAIKASGGTCGISCYLRHTSLLSVIGFRAAAYQQLSTHERRGVGPNEPSPERRCHDP
jgi:hypothetical protein